jgi:uncharacterized cupredoxin-like copper-binding protein
VRRRRPLWLLAALTAGALLLAGCGGTDAPAQTDAPRITMTEFAFDPAEVTVPAGEPLRLVLTNDGELPHEFMVGRGPMPGDGGYGQDLLDGLHPAVTPPDAVGTDAHDAHAGFMVLLDPGETAEVTVTVPADRAGEWEIGCFQPGHYEAGMHGELTVTD